MNPTITATFLARTVTVGAVTLVFGACASHQAASPAFAPTLAPPPQVIDPAAAVDDAYAQFWTLTWSVDTVPPDQWRPRLQQVAADPVLTQLVNGAQLHHDQGITLYGTVNPHIQSVMINSQQADLVDCQDGSSSGQADARTGMPKTVGIPRNPIHATLQLGPDA